MTYTISAFSSRQPVPPLRYSALRPAATIKVEAVKCCWEMIVRCCRLHRVQLWLVVPWQMGVRHGVVLQRKCGSAVLACAAQQSLWHCMEACHALGCLGSARRERRMTARESAVRTHRWETLCRRQDLRFGPNGHRRQSFHDERNLKLGSSALSYDFTCLQFSPHICGTLTVDPA